jgi:hypothetical protein
MKRPVRGEDGYYTIGGKKFKELFGSRHQVWNGTAYKTAGELTRKDLTMNKWKRIVSSKKHKTAKKEKRLEKYGYFAKKGEFGYVRHGGKTQKKRGEKKRGGAAAAYPDAYVSAAPAAAPAGATASHDAKVDTVASTK